MWNRHWHRLARNLRNVIGAHHRMIGDSSVTQEQYLNAQRESDEAVRYAKYLIQQLQNRHLAVTFANVVGMPGYINNRG